MTTSPRGHRPDAKIAITRSCFLGRGCDEALFSEKRGFSEKGGGNSVNEGLSGPVRDTLHIAQYPFEIVLQRGGIAGVLPCFHTVSRKYH